MLTADYWLLLFTHHSSFITCFNPFCEVGDRALEAVAKGDGRLPAEELLRARDVRAALFGVVGRQRAEAHSDFHAGGARHLVGQLAHRELAGVPYVDWVVEVEAFLVALLGVHETHHALDEVVHVTERARLLARAVDG